MNKTIFKKINKTIVCNQLYGSTSHPMEIFTNIRYKDYYLRGQTCTFYDYIYFLKGHKPIAKAYYNFFLFVLVNNEYQKTLKKINSTTTFAIFQDIKADEVITFEKISNSIKNYEYPSKNPKLMIYELLSARMIPVLVERKDLEIKENLYLKKSIEEKRDIILLDMNLLLEHIRYDSKSGNIKIIYPKKIYSFPAFNYSDTWKGKRIELTYTSIIPQQPDFDFIKNLSDIICLNLDYPYLPRKDYLIFLRDIGNLAWDWIEKKKITKEYVKYLNIVESEIGDRNYPFTNFCYKFLDELIADIVKQKQMAQCQYCGDFFPIDSKRKTKKYCSEESERKKCAKQASNKRDYESHKEKRKVKARKTTKELRELIRELGKKK